MRLKIDETRRSGDSVNLIMFVKLEAIANMVFMKLKLYRLFV